MKRNPVIIIGAGVAGLAAAQRLSDVNIPTIVLDKGKGVGGRMATRRVGEAVFDHGAQYFSAKSNDFTDFVRGAVVNNIAKEWWPDIADKTHPRWVGIHGMNAIPKFLAENRTVLTGRKVVKIGLIGDAWQVMTDDLHTFSASVLLVTIPAPQALELLEKSSIHFSENPLTQIKYHPCLAVMATLDATSSIAVPGGLQINGTVVSWLADNFQKGISKHPSITIHASPNFSQKHLDGDLQAAGSLMLEAIAEFIHPAKLVDWQIHRWRYGLAFDRYPTSYFEAKSTVPLLFGGDGFGTGNVEGAYLSGRAMANLIIEKYPFTLM